MSKKTLLLLPIMVLVLAVLLYCQGCTIKFRATDVELDSVATSVYEFEGLEFTRGKNTQY